MTKNDKWKLTAARKRLLEVLVNPDYIGKNVTELCNLAEISRNSYYTFMAEDEFVELTKNTTIDLVKGKIGNVVNATYKYSLEEKGHQDRKLLLTMAGIYKDEKSIEHTGDMKINNPYSDLTTEELRKLANLDVDD